MPTRHRLWTGFLPWMLALLLCGGVVPSVRAQADEATPESSGAGEPAPTPIFAIFPKETGPMTFFDVKQEAGSKKKYTVVLINAGGPEQGDFEGRTFAVDARTKTNGGLETGGPDDLKTGTTTWLEYPNQILTLEPQTGIERTFTVSVPKDTPPGQYVTALCFETAEPLEIPGTPNLKQNLRQTIAFYLTVPGEARPEFTIEDVHITAEDGWSGVEASIVNTGTVLVRPEGRLTISNLDGTPILTTDLAFDAFFAGQSGKIQTGFGDILPAGEYLITIELRDPETGATAIVDNQPVATTTRAALAAADISPIGFADAFGQLQPNPEDPQFLSLDATISNSGEPVTDAQLSLQVIHDGELVENYVVVAPLSLPTGDTNVTNRYIPLDGWSTGTWTFTLSVQLLDRQSGLAQVLSTIRLGDPIVIP